MQPRQTVARCGMVVGIAGSLFLLGACSRPGSAPEPTPTETATTIRTSTGTRTAARPSPATGAQPTAGAVATASTAAPPPPAAPPTPTTRAGTTEGERYEVQPGDTLLDIAERYGVSVEDLVQANRLDNPDLLVPGQILIIPNR